MSGYHRFESPMGFYHVTSRGNNKQFIFRADEDKDFYINCAWKYAKQFKIQIAAYCIMNNHVHFLLGCELNQLSEFMQSLNTTYGKYYNKKYSHVGHVFQNRYFSSPIDSDRYFAECIRYIHQNPVKAGISAIDQYHWSSYRNYLYRQGPVAWEKGILLIGDTKAYITFMSQTNTERYSFFDREDLCYTDHEAYNYMQQYLLDYMRQHLTKDFMNEDSKVKDSRVKDSDSFTMGNAFGISHTLRAEMILYFHSHWISVPQIADFFSLSPWSVRKILSSTKQ